MRRWVVALALACAACGGGEESSAPPRDPGRDPARASKPNVVVVLIDTLRPDHLECYGYADSTAPFLCELAQRGVLCRRAYSASTWTAPATASLFTSLYPTQHGVLEGFFVHRTRAHEGEKAGDHVVSLNQLPDSARTLPEHFARSGWSTWGVTCNVNVTSRVGFERGFQTFRDLTGPEHGKGGAADLVLAQLREWKLNLAGAAPYFLYLHFNDVHSPWRDHGAPAVAADSLTASRAAYDGEIRFVDRVLRSAYDELGWSRDTLLCVVSDHGEEFMEHGATGHGFSVHRELMQIAWLVAWPERFPRALSIDLPVGIVDVFPTLAELAGAPFASGLEGRSIAPLFAGEELAERPLFAHRALVAEGKELWAVVRGNWKLIASNDSHQLYDIAADPLERHDLSREHPEVVAELQHELESFRARTKPSGSRSVDIQLDSADIEALKQLGYTDDHK